MRLQVTLVKRRLNLVFELHPVRPIDAAERWRPVRDLVFIIPFLFGGELGIPITGGLHVAPHHAVLPKVFGLIMRVHPTSTYHEGDLIVYRGHAFEEVIDSWGETIFALHEDNIKALLTFKDNKMLLIPQGDRLSIAAVPPKEQSEGGVILPDTQTRTGPREGHVFAVGAGVPSGIAEKWDDLKQEYFQGSYIGGEHILFSAYGGVEVRIDGVEFIVISSKDIIAILDKDPKHG